MAKIVHEWLCEGYVSYEYFNRNGPCTSEYIKAAIVRIMADYPTQYLYIGITHNPCGRWTLNYDKALPTVFRRNEAIETDDLLLQENAHQDDYEKMFVICQVGKEPIIRSVEIEAIAFAKLINEEHLLNKTKGGNGRLQEDAPFYFLYICISETQPING